jgi:hypothetical protein
MLTFSAERCKTFVCLTSLPFYFTWSKLGSEGRIMSNEVVLGPGAMLRCPQCRSEVHASENDLPDNARFRCLSCRMQTLARMQALYPDQFPKPVEVSKGEQSNDNSANSSPASRGAPKRAPAPQPKSAD